MQGFTGIIQKLAMSTGVATLIVVPSFAMAQFNQAPMLDALVEAGEIPPIEERIPASPMVVEPLESIGEYGGTWRHGLVGGNAQHMLARVMKYDHLMRWDPDYNEVIPDIAEAVDVSDDGREYVFHLREGIRWSDGAPFTADDIMFWYEAVYLNDELAARRNQNNRITVTKIDDYTVSFAFEEPSGFFLQHDVAGRWGWYYTSYPRHYFSQYHIDYNPDGIEDLMAAEGFTSWAQMFEAKAGTALAERTIERFQNLNIPTLHAWVLTRPYDGSSRVIGERNPYYFKVDPDGNQLPYIDRVEFGQYESSEVLMLRALAGEIDFRDNTDGQFGTLDQKSVFFDHMEDGDFRFIDLTPAASTELTLYLNHTHKDPRLRNIFQNRDFRIGLSHAINRQEIIDTVYVGQGEPHQLAPRESSPYYDAQMAKQFTEYDLDLANEYLDRAGFTERDSSGFRVDENGARISFAVNVVATRQPNVDGMELASAHLAEVGIDMQLRTLEQSLFWNIRDSNTHDALVWSGPGGLGWDVLIDPYGWFPANHNAFWAVAWGAWYLDPNNPIAEEPPEHIKELMDMYDALLATPDTEAQAELTRDLLARARDEFFTIGINLRAVNFGIAKNNFRNVPQVMPEGAIFANPGPTNPQTYYFASQ
ncbi:ABC transporter substrate-binding protein [Roseinatronobacter sp. S2]|uniref:ABC transporter substrate-binding protein n=1 Tax=Roseinatronobacter sp. S2 TaxID=3035471 RepID=UPI00240F20E9|nr:ABC transporter substrate-binding protein [Roseinatronobacter sp. S2]WFE74774.1 ABC transporter substrate-binding protein [Roseinatronobacter sp. S2]